MQQKPYHYQFVEGSIPCSPRHAKAVCRYLKNRPLLTAIKMNNMILQMKHQVPPYGDRAHVKAKGSYPIRCCQSIKRLLSQALASPEYSQDDQWHVVNMFISGITVQHRFFARAHGRTSAKKRQRVTITLVARNDSKILVARELAEQLRIREQGLLTAKGGQGSEDKNK